VKRSRLHPTRTIIIACAAGVVALLAGSAVAAATVLSQPSPVSSTGVIDGCWTNAEINCSHIFVLQDQGTTCPKGTTPISWNESGPADPTGAPGPSGRADRQVLAARWDRVDPSPTATESLTAVPDNSFSSAVNLGTLDCGERTATQGDNLSGTQARYVLTFNNSGCGMQVGLTASGGDTMSVYTDATTETASNVSVFNALSGAPATSK
jgi:hypothetical protein